MISENANDLNNRKLRAMQYKQRLLKVTPSKGTKLFVGKAVNGRFLKPEVRL